MRAAFRNVGGAQPVTLLLICGKSDVKWCKYYSTQNQMQQFKHSLQVNCSHRDRDGGWCIWLMSKLIRNLEHFYQPHDSFPPRK